MGLYVNRRTSWTLDRQRIVAPSSRRHTVETHIRTLTCRTRSEDRGVINAIHVLMFRGNTQRAGKVAVNAEKQRLLMKPGIDHRRMWKEMHDGEEEAGSEEKRRWEKSGMAWMKKKSGNDEDEDGEQSDEDSNSKRRWEKTGMSWMKRRQGGDSQGGDSKRRWEKSGMSWIKRPAYNNDNSDYYHTNDDDDMHEPGESMKRRWEKSGVSWIRRRK